MTATHSTMNTFAEIRAGLTQALAFIQSVEAQIGLEACQRIRFDYDIWRLELEASLHAYCHACGRFLGYDLLGFEAYTIRTGERLCRKCCQRREGPAYLRLGPDGARLAAYAAERPQALAGILVEAVRRSGRPLSILAADLGLDSQDGSILRLALAPCPRADTLTQDLAVLVAATGVNGAALAELIRTMQLPTTEDSDDPDPDIESLPF
jgi:hypothetical protein